ncbi:hypothetical protein D3C83_200410 [compost metagenome]
MASGDRRADEDFVLACVTREQGVEYTNQGHEERRALAPAQLLQTLARLRSEP